MANYLLGQQFTIETDQKSFRELMNKVVQKSDQHYYLSKLLGYDYIITYKLESLMLLQMPYLGKIILTLLCFIYFRHQNLIFY